MSLLRQSTARDKMVFMTDSSDHITGKTGLTLTITASKNGAAFASISPTVTERGNGWYSIALTSSHTDTLGDIALHVTSTGADPADIVWQVLAGLPGESVTIQTGTGTGQINISSGVVESNIKQIDGLATNGNNATLKLKQLNIINSAGDAIYAQASGGNGCGIFTAGNGSGHGVWNVGGATGDGQRNQGGSGSGHGTNSLALNSGDGIRATGGSIGGAGQRNTGTAGVSGFINIASSGDVAGQRNIGSGAGAGMQNTGGGTGAGTKTEGGATSGIGFDANGTGGQPDIEGSITGNVTGSVAEATSLGAGAITGGTIDNSALNEIRNKFLIINDTLAGPTTTPTTVTLSSSYVANDGALIGCKLFHFNQSNELIQTRTVTDYDNATLVVTVDSPWTVTPVDTDLVRIYEVSSQINADYTADSILDQADGVESGITPRGALRLIAAASAGKLSGAATTTVAIRNVGDSKTRITATVDADGNRSAVTTDVS